MFCKMYVLEYLLTFLSSYFLYTEAQNSYEAGTSEIQTEKQGTIPLAFTEALHLLGKVYIHTAKIPELH